MNLIFGVILNPVRTALAVFRKCALCVIFDVPLSVCCHSRRFSINHSPRNFFNSRMLFFVDRAALTASVTLRKSKLLLSLMHPAFDPADLGRL